MKVYLAEKKSQGHDLASVLNNNASFEDKKTYIKLGNNDVVTWCSGHLLTLATPEKYNPKFHSWNIDDLPILPESFIWEPIERVKYQLDTIKKLLDYADEVVICSDFDREGQLLAVNVLNHCHYSGKASRVKLTATDPTSIKRALDNIEDLDQTMSLYNSALARAKSDWIVGLNLTRLFTCLGRVSSNNNVINIGRVITPTINLVVERDYEIKNFKPRAYYELEAEVTVQSGTFKMRFEMPNELISEDGVHCFDSDKINAIFKDLQGKSLTIVNTESRQSTEHPPLPFSLSQLQIYASRKFDLNPMQVLNICQSLYDSRNKLTTYPRSDCQYLPESQLKDAPTIMENLDRDGSPLIKSLIAGSNLSLKSRAFSDKKMQNHSHNAIIPSLGAQNTSNLSDEELKIYNAIVLRYIAQFYPPASYDVVKIKAKCGEYSFIASGKILTAPGYRICFKDDLDVLDGEEDTNKIELQKLPPVKRGEVGYFKSLDIVTKSTRAPKRFDNASLIEAMTNVGRFVDDAENKKILDETYGLGTEPTRPVVIENMQKFGWIKIKNKYFEPTDKAVKTMLALPTTIKSPTMTALWEKALDSIANDNKEPVGFELAVSDWLKGVISSCLDEGHREKLIKMLGDISEVKAEQSFNCDKCASPLRLFDGRYGKFFKCTNKDCGQVYKEHKGKPLALYDELTAPKCPVCEAGLKAIKSKTNKIFWKCQNAQCGVLIPDMRGKPKPGEKCKECNKDTVFRFKGKNGFFKKCIACNTFVKTFDKDTK